MQRTARREENQNPRILSMAPQEHLTRGANAASDGLGGGSDPKRKKQRRCESSQELLKNSN